MGDTLDFLMKQNLDFREARLSSLFSDFNRLKSTNLDGYRANIATWQNGLSQAIEAGTIPGNRHRLILHAGAHLLSSLESEHYGTPSSLQSVIVQDESVNTRKMIPLDDYLNHTLCEDQSQWIDKPKSIFQWGLRQLGLQVDASPSLQERCFVMIDILKKFADLIAKELRSRSSPIECILPRWCFESVVLKAIGADIQFSSTDLDCLVVFLGKEKMISFDDEIIKICNSGRLDDRISSNDREIASVKSLVFRLHDQVNIITQTIEKDTLAAKQAVKDHQKMIALRHLRSRKLHERILASRLQMLSKLESAYKSIEEAATQVDFLKALEEASSALKYLNAKAGGIERVLEISERLEDDMAMVEDTNNAFKDLSSQTAAVEEEIDRELVALQNVEVENSPVTETERFEKNMELPSIPENLKTSLLACSLGVNKDGTLGAVSRSLKNMSIADASSTSGVSATGKHDNKRSVLLE